MTLKSNGQPYAEVDALTTDKAVPEAAQDFQKVLSEFEHPVILAFDEIDYITPTNIAAPQWRNGFVEFWRNMRAAYHAASRADRKVSLLISGVSSRWFSVESIDGSENAALAFVPEEYLSPLPRGAANAMIKNIGSMAGLRFEEKALEAISSYCCDMPFWIRKACSFIHGKIETAVRPIVLGEETVQPLLENYGRDEGAALALVALQHLFRVYPELREPALSMVGDQHKLAPSIVRTLNRYGIATQKGAVSGAMMRAALEMLAADDAIGRPIKEIGPEVGTAKVPINEWAEELAAISYRRNIIERTLRSIVINFLRVSSLSQRDSKSAKALLLETLPSRRRSELEPFNLDTLSEKLFWLELVTIINKHWTLFERIFGDKAAFTENAGIVNDRPDTHAKSLELSDVAMHRRALQWFDERLSRI
jgi:hypothetical protein